MFSVFKKKSHHTSYEKFRLRESTSSDGTDCDDANEHLLFRRESHGILTLLSLSWLGTIFLAFGFGIILTRSIDAGQRQESDLAWGPAKNIARRHWHRFDGSINATSIFMGPPGDEVDRAWNRFSHNKWIDGAAVVLTATEEEMAKSGNAQSPLTIADVGEANGGGAMATLEMFHQLHCLNLLRKWTHVDYYSTRDHAWKFDRTQSLRKHTDHCIDILRQVLMCNGDMGLVMFHWVKDVGPAPYPDFSTMHQCRDPVAILETAERHAAPMVQPVTKTAVAHELPTFP